MHGALVDTKTHETYGNCKMTKIMERFSRSLCAATFCLSTWCAAGYAWLPGAPPDAWSVAKSPALHNNLKHCHQTIIKSIVHSCIALFNINMHEIYILLLILFLIYLIEF